MLTPFPCLAATHLYTHTHTHALVSLSPSLSLSLSLSLSAQWLGTWLGGADTPALAAAALCAPGRMLALPGDGGEHALHGLARAIAPFTGADAAQIGAPASSAPGWGARIDPEAEARVAAERAQALERRRGRKRKRGDGGGAPLVLVVSSSANRCTDVIRALRGAGRVEKLFARHMKLKDQAKALRPPATAPIGVGTAGRCVALADADAALDLGSDRLRLLVIDMWRNSKGFSAPEVSDVAPDLKKLVQRVLQRSDGGRCKVLLW